MPLCFVSLALLLTAIAAGMFLLAKTNKDGLSNFFRFVSWFIIVSGFVGLMLCGLMCICRMCCQRHGGGRNHERMMMMHQGMRFNEECEEGEGNCNKQIIIKKFGDEGDMNCPGMQKGCCKEDGKCTKEGDCCKEGKENNMIIKKDTIIVKTK